MKKILSILLVALMLVGMLPMNALHTHAATTDTTLTPYGSNGTVASDKSSISWSEENITLINTKGSTAIRTSDTNHYRAYTGSTFTVTATDGSNITKIVFTCTSTSYASTLYNAIGGTLSGSDVTVTLSSAASSYTTNALTGQVRINKVVVTTEAAEASCSHTNTTENSDGYAATCTTPGMTNSVTCDDCSEVVTAQTEIAALGHSYVDGVCRNCGDALPVVSFSVPAQVAAVESMTADTTTGKVTLPAAADYTGKYAYTFIGWAEDTVSATDTQPVIYAANAQYEPSGNTVLYAVYQWTEGGTGGNQEYVLTDIANISATDVVVIVGNNGSYYAMSNDNGTSAPSAVAVTVSDGKITGSVADNIKWNIVKNGDNFSVYPNGTTETWLYNTDVNNGVKVGTGSYNVFTIGDDDYIQNTETGRFLGIYISQDWRSYNTGKSHTNIGNQTFGFYVLTAGGTTYYTSTLEDADTSCQHTNTTETTVNATCTDAGKTTETCDDCGAVVSETEIPATGHTEVADAAKEPTCVDTGLTEGSHCSVCNAVITAQQTVPATGEHTYVDGTCSVCGAEKPSTGSIVYQLVTDVDEITAGGQFVIVGTDGTDYYALPTTIASKMDGVSVTVTDNKVVFVEGTTPVWTVESCDGGLALYNGSSYLKYSSSTNLGSSTTAYAWSLTAVGNAFKVVSTATDARGLVFRTGSNYNLFGGYAISNVTASSTEYVGVQFYKLVVLCDHENVVDAAAVAATCTSIGYTAGKQCSDCGTYTEGHEEIPMIDHSYNSGEQTTAPGCETTGVKTYTCTACGHTKTESIDATGHKMGEGVVVEATCEKDGSKTYTCTVCGKETVETISATGHNWDEGAITTAATCETAGVRTYTCSNAGCTKTEEITALGHAWDEGVQTLAPTCETAGSMLYTCQNDSSHTKTEEITARGHSWGSDGVCTNCGAEVSRFQMVTDYMEILAGGQFVLAIRKGNTYYALGQLDTNGEMTFGSDMPGVIVTVNGSGADSWIQWEDTVPVWNVDYYTGGQNSFSISANGNYLTYGTSGTGFGAVSTTPYRWVFLNKDAQGNNETDSDYAVVADDGVVSFYTASGANPGRSINLYSTSDVLFRMYSNNNNFDTVCFFKVVKAASEECTVRFMENGTETMIQTVANGDVIDLPAPSLNTYPDGYTSFVGWVTLPCEETLIAPTDIYYVAESAGDQNTTLQVTNDMTLYALYSRTDPDAEGQSMSYYQVTDESQIAVGQYYIIVGYDETNDKWFAMSLDQYEDARGGSWVTPAENGVITIVPNDRVASFRLEQGVNIGTYGFLDVMRNQFLSSTVASESNNSLRSVATLGETESFTIQINADGSYSIISVTKDSVEYLVLYNTNDNKNPLFSCYDELTGIDKTKTYLYVGRTSTVPGTYYATNTHIHDFQLTTHVDATCTTAGYTQYTCSICGEVKMDDVVAHGHDLGEATVVEATCTTAGSSTSTCNNCGEEWVETLPALGHSEVIDEAVAATCTATGLTEGSHCDRCGEVLIAQNETAALGHKYEGAVAPNESNVPVLTHTCSVCGDSYDILLKFSAADLTLQNSLIIGFKTLTDIAGEDGFTNIRATFQYGFREEMTVDLSEATMVDGKYQFPCRYITPSQIGDTVYATLYGTYDGVEYSFQMQYGVSRYCYNMLEKETSSDAMKNLMVDMLYYCDAARVYNNYKPEESVTAELTEEQKALGAADREYTSVLNSKYETIENPTVSWKAVSLLMYHATRMQMRFAIAEGVDISNVTAKVMVGDEEKTGYIVACEDYAGQYLVIIDDIVARQLSDVVYVTLYEDGTAISNTITYSVESYVYAKQNDTDEKLRNLVQALIHYGDSARELLG